MIPNICAFHVLGSVLSTCKELFDLIIKKPNEVKVAAITTTVLCNKSPQNSVAQNHLSSQVSSWLGCVCCSRLSFSGQFSFSQQARDQLGQFCCLCLHTAVQIIGTRGTVRRRHPFPPFHPHAYWPKQVTCPNFCLQWHRRKG